MTEHKKHDVIDEVIEEGPAEDDAESPVELPPIDDEPKEMTIPKRNRIMMWFGSHKKIWIPLVIILSSAIGVLVATDVKYSVANTFMSTTAVVKVVDETTDQPIAGVDVSFDEQKLRTDSNGVATFKHVLYGSHSLRITKFAYSTVDRTETIAIDLFSPKVSYAINLKPTGTPVGFSIKDSISAKGITGAKLAFASSNTTSIASGDATLNVPPQSVDTIKVRIEADGYIAKEVDVNMSEKKKVDVKLTPVGKVYFLSNRSGKIDVMKSNLDGTEQAVVLAGTGKEEAFNTVLLASRDWKYLALKSRKEGGNAQLYLIKTADDSISVIDHGNATFSPVGWYNDQFIFTAERKDVKYYQPKQVALKSYNAASGKLTTIDENEASGDQYAYSQQLFGSPYILENRLLYTRTWSNYYTVADKPGEIMSVRPDGTQKQILKSFEPGSYNYIISRPYAPQEIYFQTSNNTGDHFYEFDGGAVKDASISQEDYNKEYPTFVISPSGKSVFWQQTRDGKNTILIGNGEGKQEKVVATLPNFKAYGWYSDTYLLISKDSRELYIMPATGVADESALVKVTDYYKPQTSFDGYGYGYGAF